MQLLHYILKCIHLEWRWLFGPFRYMLIQTVWLIVKIISIPDEELFSEKAVGCTASYFVKIIWCSCWFCYPLPILRLNIAYFAVAEGWLLLDIGWFVLFLHFDFVYAGFDVVFSSTGRDQSSLCDTPLSVCPSVRPSVRPSVNNSCYCISSEAIYHRDFIMVPVCWPYGVVVHLQF